MDMTIFVDHIRNSKNNEKILSPDRGFKLDRDGIRDRDRGNRDDRDRDPGSGQTSLLTLFDQTRK